MACHGLGSCAPNAHSTKTGEFVQWEGSKRAAAGLSLSSRVIHLVSSVMHTTRPKKGGCKGLTWLFCKKYRIELLKFDRLEGETGLSIVFQFCSRIGAKIDGLLLHHSVFCNPVIQAFWLISDRVEEAGLLSILAC